MKREDKETEMLKNSGYTFDIGPTFFSLGIRDLSKNIFSFLPSRMEYKNFLLSFLLCCMLLTTSYCYMIFEEKQNSDNDAINNNKIKIPNLPPISIVGW